MMGSWALRERAVWLCLCSGMRSSCREIDGYHLCGMCLGHRTGQGRGWGGLRHVPAPPQRSLTWGVTWFRISGLSGGGQGRGYMGLAAATWVPMGAGVPVLSPNDDPNPSQSRTVVRRSAQTAAEPCVLIGALLPGPCPPLSRWQNGTSGLVLASVLRAAVRRPLHCQSTALHSGGEGCIGRGGVTAHPPPLQGAQPMPSHCLPDAECQSQWHFVTDSNRPQALWQPPPTACLTASGAVSEVPSPSNASLWGGGGQPTDPFAKTAPRSVLRLLTSLSLLLVALHVPPVDTTATHTHTQITRALKTGARGLSACGWTPSPPPLCRPLWGRSGRGFAPGGPWVWGPADTASRVSRVPVVTAHRSLGRGALPNARGPMRPAWLRRF